MITEESDTDRLQRLPMHQPESVIIRAHNLRSRLDATSDTNLGSQ